MSSSIVWFAWIFFFLQMNVKLVQLARSTFQGRNGFDKESFIGQVAAIPEHREFVHVCTCL